MKKLVSYIFIAVSAIAIVLYQPFAVFGADDFTMTRDGYKVFIYGFPFRIVDCAAHLPMHMTPWQVVARYIGNFAVFFFCGALILQAFWRVRAPQTRQETV